MLLYLPQTSATASPDFPRTLPSTSSLTTPKMRPPLSRQLPSTLPKLLRLTLSKPYSTAPTPLIKVLDVRAPNTGRIRILTLSRPSARNAISRQLLQELRHNIDAIAAEYTADGDEAPAKKLFGGAAGIDNTGPTRALVLASDVDSCFCAGADLKERAGFTADEYVPPSSPHTNWFQGAVC